MKRLTSHSLIVAPLAERRGDFLERFGANAIHAAAGFEMHFQLVGGPAGFEELDEIGGGDDFDAGAADQLQRARHQQATHTGSRT